MICENRIILEQKTSKNQIIKPLTLPSWSPKTVFARKLCGSQQCLWSWAAWQYYHCDQWWMSSPPSGKNGPIVSLGKFFPQQNTPWFHKHEFTMVLKQWLAENRTSFSRGSSLKAVTKCWYPESSGASDDSSDSDESELVSNPSMPFLPFFEGLSNPLPLLFAPIAISSFGTNKTHLAFRAISVKGKLNNIQPKNNHEKCFLWFMNNMV